MCVCVCVSACARTLTRVGVGLVGVCGAGAVHARALHSQLFQPALQVPLFPLELLQGVLGPPLALLQPLHTHTHTHTHTKVTLCVCVFAGLQGEDGALRLLSVTR